MIRWWRSKSVRVRFAIALLISVGIGYPSTAIAQWLGVPLFEQTMLALSWLAPAITAIDVLFTAQVHEKQEEASEKAEH